MKTVLAFCFAIIYGLIIRLLFDLFDGEMNIMSITFMVLLPATIGYLTIWLTPRNIKISNAGAFFRPWISCFGILVITIITELEGAICWAMAFPLLAILAGLGGLMANSKRVKTQETKEVYKSVEDLGKEKPLKVSFLLLLPLLIGFAEADRTQTSKEIIITKEITIHASPRTVWTSIFSNNKVDIKEESFSMTGFLGFPHHLQTLTDKMEKGGRRTAVYENGLVFEETITAYEAERFMKMSVKTDPAKIPATTLDEHIVIGGKHVEVLEDTYTLIPVSEGKTKLTLSSRFRITTPFNWYAGIWSNYLMRDLLKGQLQLIKLRTLQKN